jgi:hypothetical protein
LTNKPRFIIISSMWRKLKVQAVWQHIHTAIASKG